MAIYNACVSGKNTLPYYAFMEHMTINCSLRHDDVMNMNIVMHSGKKGMNSMESEKKYPCEAAL